MHPLLSSSLFPWEAKSTVFGCVGEVKVSFLPVTHTSRTSLLPNLDRRPSRHPHPRDLECPQELRHARQLDPEPRNPLRVNSIRLSSGLGTLGDSASSRPARLMGWGGVNRLTGG